MSTNPIDLLRSRLTNLLPAKNPNELTVYFHLRSLGFNLAAVCGIMGNIYHESTFNPTAVGDGGNSYGLCQWHKTRRDALRVYANNQNRNFSDSVVQMDFMVNELSTSSYTSLLSTLKSVPNTAEGAATAATNFCITYERPANALTKANQRATTARTYYNILLSDINSDYSGYSSSSESINVGISQSPTDVNIGLTGDLPLSSINRYQGNLMDALDVLDKAHDSYCSIVDLKYGGEFKFYFQNGVSENVPVSWGSPGNIPGTSVPAISYDHTGAKSVSIELVLFAGENYRPDLNLGSNKDPVGTLHSDLDFLRSLEYPDYSTAIVNPPPVVLASFGKSLKIRGVIQGLSIHHERPLDSLGRSMKATVSFSVVQVSDDPPGLLDIRNRTVKSY